MMQSIKIVLLLFALFSFSCAEHQISITGGYTVESVSSSGKAKTKLNSQGKLLYHGTIPIGDYFLIQGRFLSENVGGAKSCEGAYNQHRTYTDVFDGGITGRFRKGIQEMALVLEADITPGSKPIRFPLVPSDGNEHMSDLLQHRDGLGIGTAYALNAKHIRVALDVLYKKSSFDRLIGNSTTFYIEGDLYYHGNAAVQFWDQQVFAGISLFEKNDLNTYSGYNWRKSAVETGTSLILNKRKTLIYSRFAFTDLKGYMIKENGYTTGMGGEAYLRLTQKVSRGLFLKADMGMTVRTKTTKGRLGASLRKAWKTTSIEGGYWTTKGSLFPRQCGWAAGSVKLVKNHLELQPTMKNYWIVDNDSYRYYRTDMAMTVNIRPLENLHKLTVCGGGLWKNYDNSRWFSSGVELFLGMETIL